MSIYYSTRDLTREEAEKMLIEEIVMLIQGLKDFHNNELEYILWVLNGDRTLNKYLILKTHHSHDQ